MDIENNIKIHTGKTILLFHNTHTIFILVEIYAKSMRQKFLVRKK